MMHLSPSTRPRCNGTPLLERSYRWRSCHAGRCRFVQTPLPSGARFSAEPTCPTLQPSIEILEGDRP
jgi:hypothetical protein